MKTELPTFAELAEAQLEYANRRAKIITIKVAINTARMMVAAERNACANGSQLNRYREEAAENYGALIETFQELLGPGESISREELLAHLSSRFVRTPQATMRTKLTRIKEIVEDFKI